MYFQTTEIQMAARSPEILYWLSAGATIFRHQQRVWLTLRHHKGHRVMIPIYDEDLQRLGDRVRFDGIRLTLSKGSY